LAQNLRAAIEAHSFQKAGQITASFGVGEYRNGMVLQTVISKIDKALYRAKENGKNRVEQVDS